MVVEYPGPFIIFSAVLESNTGGDAFSSQDVVLMCFKILQPLPPDDNRRGGRAVRGPVPGKRVEIKNVMASPRTSSAALSESY